MASKPGRRKLRRRTWRSMVGGWRDGRGRLVVRSRSWKGGRRLNSEKKHDREELEERREVPYLNELNSTSIQSRSINHLVRPVPTG